jgi:hypothetical protein
MSKTKFVQPEDRQRCVLVGRATSSTQTERELTICGLEPAMHSRLLARARTMTLIDFERSLTSTECMELTVAMGDTIKIWDEANQKRKARRQRDADRLIRSLWSFIQKTTSGDAEETDEIVVLRERVRGYYADKRRRLLASARSLQKIILGAEASSE